MPTYGYRCPACGRDFEVFQRMTDESGADCPDCGSPAKRVFFPAGIVFKGSGFYKTDSRSATNGAPSPSGSSPKPAGDSTSKDSGKSGGSGSSDSGASGKDSGGSSGKDSGSSATPSTTPA